MHIELPTAAAQLLQALHAAGHSAYAVGGCVRDSLRGHTPGDWDLCTSATPEQMQAIFAADRLLLNGAKHGTVAVVRGGKAYEITTYRLDGAYSDHRRPDRVDFVPDVHKDLARRDFTVNAMAWAPDEGLIDDFGGQADLAAGIIRCVGDPAARFAEDALRILRAVRFAAQLDFTIDPATAAAAVAARDTLQTIAAERLFAELDKLLAGPAAGRALARYGEILAGVIPEIAPCLGCQQGPGHIGDVWQHTAAAVGALPAVLRRDIDPGSSLDEKQRRMLRWALLLHDLAKPACRRTAKDGHIRFPGHNRQGAALAAAVFDRLKAPAYLREQVPPLIALHDTPLPDTDPAALRFLNRCRAQGAQALCCVKLADLAAHARTPAVLHRRQEARRFWRRTQRLQDACYTTARLAVNGADVLAAGIPAGPAVGQALQGLLEQVMDGTLPNERGALLAALEKSAQEPPAKAAPQP